MNSMLDQQFKMRMAAQSDLEITLTLADYLAQLGVVVPLSSGNFDIIKSYVEEFDFSRDIFGEIEIRVGQLKKAAPILMRIGNDPFIMLSSALFGTGPNLSEAEIESLKAIGEPDELDTLIFGVIVSKGERVIAAYKAAREGSYEELENMLRDDGTYVEIFGPDARELTWINAVEEAVDSGYVYPLAQIFDPELDYAHSSLYFTLPGTDERQIVDALRDALFKREPEALRELLHRSGFTISRLPKKKATDA